jgi:hypothetical protein
MYNPAYQKVVINSAYVVQGDGTRIDAPENSIVGFLPGEAAKSAFYNNIRTVCVVHAGLELGCTIYLDYTVESSPDYLPELDVFQVIQQSSPVDAMNITFNVPSGRKLRYKLHDAGIDYGVSDVTDGDVKTVKFTMADVPASSKDPGTSILCGDIPFISACTWESNAAPHRISRFTAPGGIPPETAQSSPAPFQASSGPLRKSAIIAATT